MATNIFLGLLGLAFGSFLNVVITRLPRGEPPWAGRSRCPLCATVLPWQDNLPLLSYLFLKGRCRFCGGVISWRYPAVELTGGVLALALWQRFPPPLLLVYGPFSAALVVLSAIDLETRLLPDVITLPGIALGLLLALIFRHLAFWQAVAGALMGGAIFSGICWVYRKLAARRGLTGEAAQGLGGGDVKLLAFIGSFLGVEALPLVIFISAALGSLAGLLLVLKGGWGQRAQWRFTSIPYGPFLAAAALLYLFAGDELLQFLGFA